jgi:hypothetical protein
MHAENGRVVRWRSLFTPRSLVAILTQVIFLVALSPVAVANEARVVEVFLPHASGITVLNQIAGNVCIQDDEPTEVCGRSEFIDIVGENLCDWSDDIQYPCTWYGYQFDYEDATAGQTITCDVYRSNPTVFGPETQVTGPSTARYTLEVGDSSGHIFHPSYNTYAPVRERLYIRESHRCQYAETPLYDVNYIIRFTPE